MFGGGRIKRRFLEESMAQAQYEQIEELKEKRGRGESSDPSGGKQGKATFIHFWAPLDPPQRYVMSGDRWKKGIVRKLKKSRFWQEYPNHFHRNLK